MGVQAWSSQMDKTNAVPCRASALKALTFTFALFYLTDRKQLPIRATNQILFFFLTPANNLISRPLNAAAAVCKVRQGDTDHGSSQQLPETRQWAQPPRLFERSEILYLTEIWGSR